jgi:hypothetical protein
MMPKLFCDANPSMIAYVLDGGGSGYQNLAPGETSMTAEYLAIIFGLSSYFLKWQEELDARQYNGLTDETLTKVATPSQETKRPLPPPVLVCSDNEVVVKQLSRQYHISNEAIRKLAQRIWQMTANVDVKYQWIPRAENIAGKMLK